MLIDLAPSLVPVNTGLFNYVSFRNNAALWAAESLLECFVISNEKISCLLILYETVGFVMKNRLLRTDTRW